MKSGFTLLPVILLCGFLSTAAVAQHGHDAALVAACDELLAGQFHADGPGATALVARKGKILYHGAFGMANVELQVPMNVRSVFRIGSITKQFTAVAILILMEQGKLGLQDDITRFIPDYPTQGNRVTIEHLLTHTSGIHDYAQIRDGTMRGAVDYTPRELVEFFKDRPLRFPPGTRWEYSNSNYALLGYIIELLGGCTYGDYLEKEIFGPAGMINSSCAGDNRVVMGRADGYSRSGQGYSNTPYLSMTQPYAAGAIQSTVEDLYAWHQALHSYRLVSQASLEKALTRSTLKNGDRVNYGYGWRFGYIQDSPSIWHGGWVNGFIAMQIYLPREDVFVAVLSNCDCNSPEDVSARLAAVAIGDPYGYEPVELDDAILNGYTGVYENESGQLRVVTLSGSNLYAQSGRGPKAKIDPYAPDRFVFEGDEFARLEFIRGDAGAVERLRTRDRKEITLWNRTDRPFPSPDGIEVSGAILESYVGEYRISPEFAFVVSRDGNRLFVKATGQESFEIFAESETRFFVRINDAQLEFLRDDRGRVTKAVLTQDGRTTEANRVR